MHFGHSSAPRGANSGRLQLETRGADGVHQFLAPKEPKGRDGLVPSALKGLAMRGIK